MNPLAIALQGIGFGVALVAVQGFAVLGIEPASPTDFYSGADDDSARITRQNNAVLQMVAAFLSTGALE